MALAPMNIPTDLAGVARAYGTAYAAMQEADEYADLIITALDNGDADQARQGADMLRQYLEAASERVAQA